MTRVPGTLLVAFVLAVSVNAQTPKPFPQPPKPGAPPPASPTTAPPAPRPAAPATSSSPAEVPTDATMGVPIYPNAQFLTSYDAGRGQRYYLFGATTPYADLVLYYRNALKQKGNELFDSPPTHQFETGRFREETMAFPPSVTIKDYTWGGSAGYPNPKRGGKPDRFPTLIQIVPVPAGGSGGASGAGR